MTRLGEKREVLDERTQGGNGRRRRRGGVGFLDPDLADSALRMGDDEQPGRRARREGENPLHHLGAGGVGWKLQLAREGARDRSAQPAWRAPELARLGVRQRAQLERRGAACADVDACAHDERPQRLGAEGNGHLPRAGKA